MGDILIQEFTYEANDLPSQAFTILTQLLEQEKLCDVTIKAGERKIRCHRVVLASCSAYFHSMFTNSMLESSQEVITIQGLSEKSVIQLINFMYTRKITITIDNIESLLTASAVFQLDPVVYACCEFMKRHLHVSNCLEMRAYAELHGCIEFIHFADKFARGCFTTLVSNDMFLKLSPKHLAEIVSGDDLNVKAEEIVFEAILKWVEHDPEKRSEHIADLISQVRLPLLPTDYLINRVEQNSLLSSNMACRNFIDEAKNFKLCPVNVSSFRTQPRKSTAGTLFSVGGRGKTGEPFQCIECYDWFSDSWFMTARLSTPRRHVAVASLNGRVYAIGGHDGIQHLNSVECFDPENNTWTDVAPMRTYRRGMSAGVLQGVIYVAGGLDEATCFETVERYDPETDEWSIVSSMLHRRGGVGVAGLEGYLYAVGGNDGTVSLQSVERYNPHTGRWTRVASMNRRRAGVGVAVVGQYLYAIGGFDDSNPLDSVERYDPKTNQWSYIASMSTCRGGVGAGSMGERIWAVGGHNGTQYLGSMESYNPAKDVWEASAQMSTPRAGSGVTGCMCDVQALKALNWEMAVGIVFVRLNSENK
ncbi:predicted protein [Nematostella vectensis]|uniref:BTB domain-containing protein n=1 Tax=Nematostella vectensis TaxID=45351 RepID=A7RFM5_NEMVE|nr:predicted protein [Nematostella vectensis]|eukprot:XP_001641691.1 predicted protein [Nematostella vectensis]